MTKQFSIVLLGVVSVAAGAFAVMYPTQVKTWRDELSGVYESHMANRGDGAVVEANVPVESPSELIQSENQLSLPTADKECFDGCAGFTILQSKMVTVTTTDANGYATESDPMQDIMVKADSGAATLSGLPYFEFLCRGVAAPQWQRGGGLDALVFYQGACPPVVVGGHYRLAPLPNNYANPPYWSYLTKPFCWHGISVVAVWQVLEKCVNDTFTGDACSVASTLGQFEARLNKAPTKSCGEGN